MTTPRRWSNPTTRESGHVVWNPGFESFCRDRGLTSKACRPRRARTKGKIEPGVGYVKHNALAGRPFASFQELQRHLAKWMIEVADRRIHGTTRERPAVRFERDERQELTRATSQAPILGCSRKVDKQRRTFFRRVDFSSSHSRHRVSVMVFLRTLCTGSPRNACPRRFGRR